ncbi:MAG TPA: hypothetical protein VHD60_04490 [Candidatus Saccharimonadales bacterium]|nr:hypothetical protein [Candidatus Saccharimonadales bacterium]
MKEIFYNPNLVRGASWGLIAVVGGTALVSGAERPVEKPKPTAAAASRDIHDEKVLRQQIVKEKQKEASRQAERLSATSIPSLLAVTKEQVPTAPDTPPAAPRTPPKVTTHATSPSPSPTPIAASQEIPAHPVPGADNPSANEALAQQLAAQRYGWVGEQWVCLDALWKRESHYVTTIGNPTSGAYGIPQALPGGKMASAGADWRTNPETQEIWGLDYINGRYHDPCAANAHSVAHNWY